MSGRLASRLMLLALVTAFVAGLALGALAYASTGVVFRENVNTPTGSTTRVCGEAAVDPVSSVYNYGYTRAYHNSPCSVARVLPTGWISVRVHGYRNGAYCGNSGWRNSSGASATAGTGSPLCTNPSGSQEFWTTQDGRVWQQPINAYNTVPSLTSPHANA